MKILSYYRAAEAYVRLTYLRLFCGIKRINYSIRIILGIMSVYNLIMVLWCI